MFQFEIDCSSSGERGGSRVAVGGEVPEEMVPGRTGCSLVPALHKGSQKEDKNGTLLAFRWKGAEGAGVGALNLLEDKAAKASESCSATQNTEATSW